MTKVCIYDEKTHLPCMFKVERRDQLVPVAYCDKILSSKMVNLDSTLVQNILYSRMQDKYGIMLLKIGHSVEVTDDKKRVQFYHPLKNQVFDTSNGIITKWGQRLSFTNLLFC